MNSRTTMMPAFEISEEIELERYELREPPAYQFATNRREFNAALGAGLLILVPASKAFSQRQGRRARRDEPLGDRMHVAEDGTVTVFTSKVEVGQGSRTQITQAAAEELRLPIDQIQLVMADTMRCPDDGGTAGSRTTPSTVPRVRSACAAARERLVDLAAKELGIAINEVSFAEGKFTASDGKQITLAELAQRVQTDEALSSPPDDEVAVKRVSEWKVLGTSLAKVGGKDIVTGRHQYPSDIKRPEMMYGKVLRPPRYQAKLTSIDLQPAEAMDNVTVVRDGQFVGCVAPTSWQAGKAIAAIAETAQWEHTELPESSEFFTHFKQTARERGGRRRRGGRGEWGDREKALAKADQKMQASYEIAYIQHAPMEPRAAVAEWQDDKLQVWTGTQQPARVVGELRQAFSLAEEQVRVIVPDTGGGFGGKHTGEAAIEAARLAKATSKPVSLRWTREEEFTWAYFRPGGLIEVEAAIENDGKIVTWDFTNYNSGGSAVDTPYEIPNGRTRVVETDSPLRQGSYRALASTANTFARESAMDQLAELAGTDPLDFRLAHLGQGRLRDVLEAAAKRFDWRKRRAANEAVGIACGTEKGSYVAACAKVEVRGDEIRLLSICQAYECGAIQNPQNLQMQVEGCIIMGLGAALREAMLLQGGKITNASFYDYQVPRMSDLPEMDIVLVDRPDLPSIGAGETPIIAVAPAIAGAVYAATGKRCRSMPLQLNSV